MVFLPIFIILVIILNIKLAKTNKTKKTSDAFIEVERLANSARKKEIPGEIYVHVNKDILPLEEYNKDEPYYHQLTRAQESVIKKIDQKMLKLPVGMNNNDIKLAYGIANFEHVVTMEECYENCIKALINWAETLLKSERAAQAEAVLLETINLKSDYSKNYTLLCDIYLKQKNNEKLAELKCITENPDFLGHNITVRDKIREYVIAGMAKMED